jgi:hypothetical protein
MSRRHADGNGEGYIRQIKWRCQRILHSQAGMAEDVCTSRPIPSLRAVLMKSVYKMSTEDLGISRAFHRLLRKICACSRRMAELHASSCLARGHAHVNDSGIGDGVRTPPPLLRVRVRNLLRYCTASFFLPVCHTEPRCNLSIPRDL